VLEPLNQVQTAELVERLAGDLPSAIQERIVERSGGNPFFAAELVRGLAERGLGRDVQDLDVVPDHLRGGPCPAGHALAP
jgi:predicted ATPase